MSWMEAERPRAADSACVPVELAVVPKPRDIGGFSVARVLPSARRRAVGAFVFFDQMGPATMPAGQGLDVRPHPHIGLSTITYLFEGEMMHRDSLGTVQRIRPGEVNWMTAGRGIVHSERSPDESRRRDDALWGIQAWVALPRELEECEPSFQHLDSDALPNVQRDGVSVRVIAGGLLGLTSPLKTASEIMYADVRLEGEAAMTLGADYEERGLYLVTGSVEIAGESFDGGQLLVFREGIEVTIRARTESRFMLLGGAPLDGPRHLWWNFVSSNRDRIERAKAAWREGVFPPVPGDDERIPLPER